MPKVLIIADDLTGANDSAVQFARRGFTAATLLLSEDGEPQGLLPQVDVLAVSTESRNVTAEVAAEQVRRVASTLVADLAPEVMFKKIDSTLRGNAGAEVGAVAGLVKPENVVVAPAYPSNGRTVRAGNLFVNGKPLLETYAAHDVLAPVRSSRVRDYFESLESRPGMKVTFADAGDDADLLSLVDSFAGADRVLWVGSAGLARALAESLPRRAAAPRERPACSRTLALFGSMNPVAKAQVDVLLGANGCSVILPASAPELHDAVRALASVRDRNVIVSSHCLQDPCRDVAAMSRLVKSSFGEIAERAVESKAFGALVVCGGDVAFAVLRRLGATAITVEQEILPGVAFGTAIGGQAPGLGIVTKAGGFGDSGSLRKILAYLAGER